MTFALRRPGPEAAEELARLHIQCWHEAARGWKSQGGKSLGLGVLADNAKARAFYEKMGGKLARTGTWVWDGHPLADATYIFEGLDALGKH